jgi:hypothetical protein
MEWDEWDNEISYGMRYIIGIWNVEYGMGYKFPECLGFKRCESTLKYHGMNGIYP